MKVFAFVLMIFLPTLASAEPIFPQYKSCMDGKDKSNGCTIFLDESGFLVDAATGARSSQLLSLWGQLAQIGYISMVTSTY